MGTPLAISSRPTSDGTGRVRILLTKNQHVIARKSAALHGINYIQNPQVPKISLAVPPQPIDSAVLNPRVLRLPKRLVSGMRGTVFGLAFRLATIHAGSSNPLECPLVEAIIARIQKCRLLTAIKQIGKQNPDA
jgi:hypothetical protein